MNSPSQEVSQAELIALAKEAGFVVFDGMPVHCYAADRAEASYISVTVQLTKFAQLLLQREGGKQSFNDWFLSLPAERQAILREDKWMLAQAAFEAAQPPAAAVGGGVEGAAKIAEKWAETADFYGYSGDAENYRAIAAEIRALGFQGYSGPCSLPPAGWKCTRTKGHDGPCAAVEAQQPAAAVGGAVYQVRADDDDDWFETIQEIYEKYPSKNRRILFTTPQPNAVGELVEHSNKAVKHDAGLKTDDQIGFVLAAIQHYGSQKYSEGKGLCKPDLLNVREAWDAVYAKVQALASVKVGE